MKKQQPAAETELEKAQRLLQPVESSNLTSTGYDPETQVLYIEFHGGRLYAYDHVPTQAYAAFKEASSQGSHFTGFIRDRYEFRRLDEGKSKAKKKTKKAKKGRK